MTSLQVLAEGNSLVREDAWTAGDFPAEIDRAFPITSPQDQYLKTRLIGQKVQRRDPAISDKLLKSWGMRT